MRKLSLLFLTGILISLASYAQENPCPTVSGLRKTDVVRLPDGVTCSATMTLHITNDVANANPKGVRVEVFCGSLTNIPVVNQCFLASTIPGGADFTTNAFTCRCDASIFVRITRYTASNGECQGGVCGQVLIIQEGPLPVSFTSFTAARNKKNVSLKWETAFEQNSAGFEVQRSTGNDTWQTVARVPSQAPGGNSQIPLTYSFSDINDKSGITQYRVQQADLDGHSKYTEVRAVRGEGQTGKVIVYPNPSTDGKLSIVFEDANVKRDVRIVDMAGRIVKEMKSITNNNVQINNLNPGMYTARIMVPETGDETTEKFIVNKR
jgi:hypothetical protein